MQEDGFIGLSYKLADNRQEFTALRLNFSDEGVSSLRLTRKKAIGSDSAAYTTDSDVEKLDISFGIGKMCEGNFPIYNTPYTAGAIWLRENVLLIRVHLIGESVGSIRFELYFQDSEVTVFMRKIEETYFNEFDGHLYGTLT